MRFSCVIPTGPCVASPPLGHLGTLCSRTGVGGLGAHHKCHDGSDHALLLSAVSMLHRGGNKPSWMSGGTLDARPAQLSIQALLEMVLKEVSITICNDFKTSRNVDHQPVDVLKSLHDCSSYSNTFDRRVTS